MQAAQQLVHTQLVNSQSSVQEERKAAEDVLKKLESEPGTLLAVFLLSFLLSFSGLQAGSSRLQFQDLPASLLGCVFCLSLFLSQVLVWFSVPSSPTPALIKA